LPSPESAYSFSQGQPYSFSENDYPRQIQQQHQATHYYPTSSNYPGVPPLPASYAASPSHSDHQHGWPVQGHQSQYSHQLPLSSEHQQSSGWPSTNPSVAGSSSSPAHRASMVQYPSSSSTWPPAYQNAYTLPDPSHDHASYTLPKAFRPPSPRSRNPSSGHIVDHPSPASDSTFTALQDQADSNRTQMNSPSPSAAPSSRREACGSRCGGNPPSGVTKCAHCGSATSPEWRKG
jgi:hypothetical protein